MKNIKKVVIILSISLIILVASLIFILNRETITGQVIEDPDYYTYTKLICGDVQLCQDYEIVCDGPEEISVTAIGEALQYPEIWEDPRTPEEIKKIC
jgi:hypothetical protein